MKKEKLFYVIVPAGTTIRLYNDDLGKETSVTLDKDMVATTIKEPTGTKQDDSLTKMEYPTDL